MSNEGRESKTVIRRDTSFIYGDDLTGSRLKSRDNFPKTTISPSRTAELTRIGLYGRMKRKGCNSQPYGRMPKESWKSSTVVDVEDAKWIRNWKVVEKGYTDGLFGKGRTMTEAGISIVPRGLERNGTGNRGRRAWSVYPGYRSPAVTVSGDRRPLVRGPACERKTRACDNVRFKT